MPVNSVGVQGDSRTYAPVLAIDSLDHARATELINAISGVNRVIAPVETRSAGGDHAGTCLFADGGAAWTRLRKADEIVRRLTHETGYDHEVWQFPVILIPLGSAESPDSVVLRPVDSVDGMTAQSVLMKAELRERISTDLLHVAGIAGVFYDLTHKPPAPLSGSR